MKSLSVLGAAQQTQGREVHRALVHDDQLLERRHLARLGATKQPGELGRFRRFTRWQAGHRDRQTLGFHGCFQV